MTTKVLTISQHHELKDVFKAIAEQSWADIQYAYVVDADKKLIGTVDLASFSKAQASRRVADLMVAPVVTLHPMADQEKAVMVAVKDDITAVPVVGDDGQFLGAVVAHELIDVMHAEHLEDALLTAGVRRGKSGLQIAKLASARISSVFTIRAPWLIVGLVAGLGLGLISSFFEKQLQETVALAYFIPVVAYIADSVGTQSEAITVRSLALLKLNPITYVFREFLVGTLLGLLVGVLGGFGAFAISQSAIIGLIVGLSLFVASAVAAAIASLIPMVFKAFGKDPALGSGPLATAIQDVISVLIYFLFAVIFLS